MAAVEVCSSEACCPKISFSHDLPESSGIVPVEQLPPQSLSSTVDFAFFAVNHLGLMPEPPSSAEELFSDGKILPSSVIKKPPPPPPPPTTPKDQVRDEQQSKQSDSSSTNTRSFWSGSKQSDPPSANTTSFWSGSVNRGSRMCNFQILSRCNSTGSTRNVKRVADHPQHPLSKSKSQSHKHQFVAGCAKPPLKKKKSQGGGGGSMSSVLNVPIANLCGFGSLCFSGKGRIKKNRC